MIKYYPLLIKIIVAGPFYLMSLPGFSQHGLLDVNFGNHGQITDSIGSVNCIKIQPDGKVIAAGEVKFGATEYTAIIRYNNDGSLDNSFGTGGRVIKKFAGSNYPLRWLDLQHNGKILIFDSLLRRLNINGTIDSSFGVNGTLATGGPVFIKADDKLLGGTGDSLVQYTSSGQHDTTFGQTHNPYISTGVLGMQPDGKLVLLGYTFFPPFTTLTLIAERRYQNGRLDSSFGTNGSYEMLTHFLHIYKSALQPDGKVIIAGTDSNYNMKIARYTTSGTLDSTFGTNGIILEVVPGSRTFASQVHILPDGSILITSGISATGPGNRILWRILKYHPNGLPASTFGKRGVVLTVINGDDYAAYFSDVQPDGKIVVGGGKVLSNKFYFALARYEQNSFLYYNTVTGSLFFDRNSNGSKEVNESFFTRADIAITKANGVPIIANTSGGIFTIDVDSGAYATRVIPYSSYFTSMPASFSSSHADFFHTDSISFAIQPIPGKRDVAVYVIPLGVPRLGFSVNYKILYFNQGTDTILNGTVQFIKSDKLTLNAALPAATSVSGDTVRWNFADLKPLDTATIFVSFSVQPPPAVNIGDTLRSTVIISSPVTDLTPGDNTSMLAQKVTGSFDPNDKTENHAGKITTVQVANGEYLQYTIRFQNTGNDTAFNVYIRDTLDNKLDWNTMRMIGSSHNFQLNINDGRNCMWTFRNINLVDSNKNEPLSHGYLTYIVKPKSTVVNGDIITNSAAIYFDYNLPVSTNVENTIVVTDALPLKLLSFTAKRHNQVNLLQWSTAQEINVERFEVERSSNGREFGTIANVRAGLTKYDFTDNDPVRSINYYRLKVADKDGSYTYSPIRTVNNSSNFYVTVYPNPAKEKLQVQVESSKIVDLQVHVLSQDGKVLLSNKWQANEGVSVKAINIASLPVGGYYLKVSTLNPPSEGREAKEQSVVKFEKL